MTLYQTFGLYDPLPNLQVDTLNARLLSEKARHEKLQEEANSSHREEVSKLKRVHTEEILKLTAKLEQLNRDVEQVQTVLNL